MAKLHDIEVEDFLSECVRIEPLALEAEFIRQPGDLAYWNARAAEAARIYLTAKFESGKMEASLYLEIRESIEISGKRATEKMVDAEVQCREEWQNTKLAQIDAEAELARLKGYVEGMRAKRDMLIQMGSDRRAEKQNDPRINTEDGESKRY